MEGNKFENPFIDDLVGIPHGDPVKKQGESLNIQKSMETWGSKKIEGVEIEKTQRDIEIIDFAKKGVLEIMQRYDRDKDNEIPLDHIHIFHVGGVKEYTEGKSNVAAAAATRNSVIIDRLPSDVQFCIVLFHEFFHIKSYKSLQIHPPQESGKNPKLLNYRSGFSVVSRDGKERYFINFEEALIGIFTEEFFEKEIKSSSLFQEELKRMGGMLPELTKYQTDIDQMNKMIDMLWERNKTEFENRDEILNLFIDAQINGNVLTVGKLIEKIFGKGSFRQAGKGNMPEYDIE